MLNNCKDCFNGCHPIVSDNCTQYTGPDISLLGISNGDTLAFVESQIFSYILSIITGEGVIIDLQEAELCDLISSYLPLTEIITLENIIKALTQAVCFVNTKIIEITNQLNLLEADYDIKCLQGVTNSSNTHLTLQATINKVCKIQADFTVLLSDLATNYVTSGNINQYIQNYNQTVLNTNLISFKMIPKIAYEYYPSSAELAGNFDTTGAGLGIWAKVYLCNGDNGTPDKRGRVAVGATNMAGVIPMITDINPSVSNFPNPAYAIGSKFGKNSVALSLPETAAHTHTATATAISTDAGHNHTGTTKRLTESTDPGTGRNAVDITATEPITINVGYAQIKTTVDVTNSIEGNSQPHNNIQPSIGAYYIMYIP